MQSSLIFSLINNNSNNINNDTKCFYSTLELGFLYAFSYILLFNPYSNPVRKTRWLLPHIVDKEEDKLLISGHEARKAWYEI